MNEPGLFNPELVIDNDAGLQLTHWEFQVKDSKTGLVKLSEYYRGKLMIPNMSLDMFPFDFQKENYFKPLLNGTKKECYAITEKGAGSAVGLL